MRLFQKPCANPNDVVVDDGVKRVKKGGAGGEALMSDQYEFVRREFGYDYVPPSQYVPSQSFDDDDDDEFDEDYDGENEDPYYGGGGGGGRGSIRRDHLPYQNHVGPVPVQVIDPRSEISADELDTEFDNFHHDPPPPRRQKRQQARPTRTNEGNREVRTTRAPPERISKDASAERNVPRRTASQREHDDQVPRRRHPQQQHHQPKGYTQQHRQRHESAPHPMKKQPPTRPSHQNHDEEQYSGRRRDGPVRDRQTNPTTFRQGGGGNVDNTEIATRQRQQQQKQAIPVGARRLSENREIVVSKQRSRSPASHRGIAAQHVVNKQRSSRSPASYRDAQQDDAHCLREKKSFLDDEFDSIEESDEIDRVHTAFSYTSKDSAEVFVRERSNGSRYNSTTKETRRPRRKPVDSSHGREKQTGGRRSPVVREGRDDATTVNDDAALVEVQHHNDAVKNRRGRREREGDISTSKLSDHEESRYERKNDAVSQRRQHSLPYNYNNTSNHHRDRKVTGPKRQDRRRGEISHRQAPPPPPQRRGRRQIPSRGYEEEADRRVVDRVSSEEFEIEVEHGAFDSYYYDDHQDAPRGRDSYRGDDSYYITPSGKASDVKFVETKGQPEGKRKSKGLFGKLRDSVRGSSTAKKEGNSISGSGTKDVRKATRSSKGVAPSKSRAMFEQVPPSVRSDVSFERPASRRNHNRDVVRDDSDDTTWDDTRHHQRRGHGRLRNQHGYVEQPQGSRIPQDPGSEKHYRIDDYERQRVRRQLHRSPRGYYEEEEEEYWDEDSRDFSDTYPQDNHAPHSPGNNSPRQIIPPPPPEPFEFFDSEPAPALRANPDHRHVPVSRTMARRHPNTATATSPVTTPLSGYNSHSNYNYNAHPLSPAGIPDAYNNLQPFSQKLERSPSLVDVAFPKSIPPNNVNTNSKGFTLFQCR
jgi:hypothetical protein